MSTDPILVRAAIVALGTAVFSGLVLFGIDVPAETRDMLVAGTSTVALAILAFWSRGKVTPTSDPRDDNGTPLTPATAYEKAPENFIEIDPEEWDAEE